MSHDPELPERFGPFVLLRQLGVGGMGAAYLAMNVDDGKLLVVKRMHAELLKDDSIFKRFVHEAEVATHVRHPNVAQLVAMGAIDREPFLATEFVFGIQVSQIVDRIESSQVDPIPLHIGLFLAVELASGVEAIHLARHRETGGPLGLIHRDIGSRNVLVGFDGQIRIIDLGLGKSVLSDWQTAAQVLAGSPDYMPPEQAMGARVDGRADVYSAAVTIWEIIAGRKRIREEGVAARLAKAIQAQPEPLLDVRPDAPKRLEAILKQGMHPDPELRTPTATIFKKALTEELKDRGRGVTRDDVNAWLDSACATVIAKEKRLLSELRAKGMAFMGRGTSAAKTELFVGKPGALDLAASPYEFYETPSRARPGLDERVTESPRDPADGEAPIWSKVEQVAASSATVAALAALVDPENFRRQPPHIRLLVVTGAFAVLVVIAVATAIVVMPPPPDVSVVSIPESGNAKTKVVSPPVPPPAKIASQVATPPPVTPPPVEPDVPLVSPPLTKNTPPPVEPPKAMPPEVASKKSDLVRRIKQMRRTRFDVSFQKRLTELSTRLSKARTMKALDEIEGALVRLEAES